jgi:hypothetical protein
MDTAPRALKDFNDTGHWMYPEQREIMDGWLCNKLFKKE